MKWTEKQLEAINVRNKDILVSAAAGSGKTAVLVERIKNILIKDKVNIDEILVVTFTNAAAAEMKEKIVNAIVDEIEKNQGDTHFLEKQLNLINNSYISTFHGFALEIIRRFFHIISIEPDFKICDNGQQIILQEKAMDLLLEKNFEEGNKEFLELLNSYASSKNEKEIRNIIKKVYFNIMSIPEPWKWLEEKVQVLMLEEDDFKKTEAFQIFEKQVLEKLDYAIYNCENGLNLLDEMSLENLYKKLIFDLEKLKDVKRLWEEKNYDKVRNIFENISFVTLVAKKEEKEAYNEVKESVTAFRKVYKDIITELKTGYLDEDLQSKVRDIQKTYKYANTILSLVKEFKDLYSEEKKAMGVIDFTDIEHYCLEILKEENVAKEYRDKFKHIFIDEYQDSNIIQETLINAIKKENNVFMVGDIKQSIYKFRLAEPEIFQGKYESFKDIENDKNQKIDLNYNFRSKKSVIDSVNDVFKYIMPKYDEEAQLYQGIDYDGNINHKTEFHIVDTKVNENSQLIEELAELKTVEKEGYFVGKIILDTIGKPIFDAKKGVERKIQKKDIVVLLRNQKNYGDKFQEVFSDMGIQSHISESDGYFDTTEIELLLNLINVIENRRNDIALISVLYSSFFKFEIEELIEIRIKNKDKTYFEALEKYGEEENVLGKKVRETLSKIARWKELSRYLPLDEFIWKLLDDTGYYNFVCALPDGNQRKENILALIDKSRQFQNSQMKGLFGFVKYIEAIKDRKVPTGEAKILSENDDVVKIMTIHKSKGLEFPVVIVAGLGKNFNRMDERGTLDIHKDIGLGIKEINIDDGYQKKTLLQKIINNQKRREDLEEQIRILYVAFTRAMDKLVLVGTEKNLEKAKEKIDSNSRVELIGINNFMDLLYQVVKKSDIEIKYHQIDEIELKSISDDILESNIKDFEEVYLRDYIEDKNNSEYEYIDYHLSYEYPQENVNVKAKLSVTDVNQNNIYFENKKVNKDDFLLKQPLFSQIDKNEFTSAEKGTILHSILENWDFGFVYDTCGDDTNRIRSYGENKIDQLVGNKYLTEAQGQQGLKDIDLIVQFQKSDLGIRISQSKEVVKEMPFNILDEIDGKDVIIQGVIDCFFLEEDKYVLVDYKSTSEKNLAKGDDEIRNTYRRQMDIYKKAIEKAKGVSVSKSYLYMLRAGKAIEI